MFMGFLLKKLNFLVFFAKMSPNFEDNAIEVIAAGLIRGACAREIERSARLLQSYELDFWEAVGEPPISDLPVARSVSR